MGGFLFKLGAPVKLKLSEERGVVIGRAEYSFSDNTYLIRYKAADGRAVESWWSESALEYDLPKSENKSE